MAHQHAYAFVIHMVVYSCLYPFWRKRSLFLIGFLFLGQLFGLDMIFLWLQKGNQYYASGGLTALLCPFVVLYSTKDFKIKIGGKIYSGFREYLLLIDTDLKYVIVLFMLSLIINFYLNPLSDLLNYTNTTAMAAFLLSIPFCRRMSRLKEQQA